MLKLELFSFESLQIASIAHHSAYQTGSIDYDVAVIRLREQVALDQSSQLITLPSSHQEFAGLLCNMIGWTESMGGIRFLH